jgi:UDP-N-acetylmuramyl-tripeptide synthetase
LFGQFNAQNLLAVIAALNAMNYPVKDSRTGIAAITPVIGRMDVINSAGLTVIVDYAHTPDALEKCLNAVRDHFQNRSLSCVFGCGGDRDATKRPVMGEIASRLADRIIVTDDNPRGEPSNIIIEEILAGVSGVQALAISDRSRAIKTAIETAEAGEVVLVAGKGHEDYQETGGRRVHFSDYEEINSALALKFPNEKLRDEKLRDEKLRGRKLRDEKLRDEKLRDGKET